MPSLLPFPASPEPTAKIAAAPGTVTAPRSQENQAADSPSFDDVLDSEVEASEDDAGLTLEDHDSELSAKETSAELLLPAGIALTSPQALLIAPQVPVPIDPTQNTSTEDIDGLPVELPSVADTVSTQFNRVLVAAKPAEGEMEAVQPNAVAIPAPTELTAPVDARKGVELPVGLEVEQAPSIYTGPELNAPAQSAGDASAAGETDSPNDLRAQPHVSELTFSKVPPAVSNIAPASPVSPAPFDPKAGAVTPATPGVAAPEIAVAVTVQTNALPNDKGTISTPVAGVVPSKASTLDVAGENSAATQISATAQAPSGELSSASKKKETSLTAVGKQVKKHYESLGTDAAKQGESTMFSFRQIFEAPLARVAELGSVGTQAASAELELPAPVGLAGQAVQAVKDIREVGEGLGLAPRPTVELKFDFSAHERLTVKVELRDGVIQTTFRTNSDDVRNAVSEAWAGQAVNPDSRQKFADPVFVSAPTRDTNSGFDFAGNSNRQQRSGDQENPSRSQSRLSFDSSRAAPAVPAPVPQAVVASDRKLRAFA